jgi:LDH2 family malate/lactate/ureidoglycolate dehydrogenase
MLERFKVPLADQVLVSPEDLHTTVTGIFQALGVPEEDAKRGADHLVATDLRGVESHGVSNMLRHYVAYYQSGQLKPRPSWRIERESLATATIDGDQGLGIIQGRPAMELAIEKARTAGVGMVTLRNSGHIGAVGDFAMLAAQQDMIGVCMTASGPSVLPTFGAEPRLGTNPYAIAAPTRRMPPLLFDVATSAVPINKIAIAQRVGAMIEPGWISTRDGVPIMEPSPPPVGENYWLLPLGGSREQGSHKGYGFGLMVEIFTNLLSGAMPEMLLEDDDYAHAFTVYNIEAFLDVERFKERLDAVLEKLMATPSAPGAPPVIYPGWPEYQTERERRANGIPLHREVVAWIDQTTTELGSTPLERSRQPAG